MHLNTMHTLSVIINDAFFAFLACVGILGGIAEIVDYRRLKTRERLEDRVKWNG